jgi:hypothetical protein
MKRGVINFLLTLFAFFVIYNLAIDYFHVPNCGPCPKGATCLPCYSITTILTNAINWFWSIFFIIGYAIFEYLFFKKRNCKIILIILSVVVLFYLLNFGFRYYMDYLGTKMF